MSGDPKRCTFMRADDSLRCTSWRSLTKRRKAKNCGVVGRLDRRRCGGVVSVRAPDRSVDSCRAISRLCACSSSWGRCLAAGVTGSDAP